MLINCVFPNTIKRKLYNSPETLTRQEVSWLFVLAVNSPASFTEHLLIVSLLTVPSDEIMTLTKQGESLNSRRPGTLGKGEALETM